MEKSDDTLDILHSRLKTAEDDTNDLLTSLTAMGLENKSYRLRSKRTEALKPFTVQESCNKLSMDKNYEQLVKRVCKNESVVQSLKLNLLQAQSERDLSQKEQYTISEKYTHACEAYDRELTRVTSDNVKLQRDLDECMVKLDESQKECQQVKDGTVLHSQSKADVQLELNTLQSDRDKSDRRMNELKDQLNHEIQLRSALESSHATLLDRIHDLEAVVEAERSQVKQVNTNSEDVKQMSQQIRDELMRERRNLKQTEEGMNTLRRENGDQKLIIDSLQKEKDLLMKEIGRMKAQYRDVNKQIDETAKLVHEKQKNHKKLQSENAKLLEAAKLTAVSDKTEREQQNQLLEQQKASIQDLQQRLSQETSERENIERLKLELEEIKHGLQKANEKNKDLHNQLEHRNDDDSKVVTMTLRVSELQNERDTAMKDKENLLDEVNQAVDSMTEEKSRLEAEVESLRLELTTMEKSKQESHTEVNQAVDSMTEEKSRLEAEVESLRLELTTMEKSKQESHTEVRRLNDRIVTLTEQQATQKQIESTLTTLTDQKNRLAYEKGRLENHVQQLQTELQELNARIVEHRKVKELNQSLQNKYKQAQDEISSQFTALQRLNGMIKQSEMVNKTKEQDFRMALESRDEARREIKTLENRVENLGKVHQKKVIEFQRTIEESQTDNRNMSDTLESMITSHTQLQNSVEQIQTQLGGKDQQIAGLVEQKAEIHQQHQKAEIQIQKLKQQISQNSKMNTKQMDSLQTSVSKLTSDNSKMAASLEDVMKSHAETQTVLGEKRQELDEKSLKLEQLVDESEKHSTKHKQEIRMLEERLQNLKQQLIRDRDKALKKTNRNMEEFRHQLDEVSIKNNDLSKSNTELRHKVTSLEYREKEHIQKLDDGKSKCESLNRRVKEQQSEIEKLQGIKMELQELERAKKECVHKNIEQSKSIENFVSQVSSLQEELITLAASHKEMSELISQQEQEINLQGQIHQELQKKYQNSQKRLEKERIDTEAKLREANLESEQISANLRTAQEWFKSKFNSLQSDLAKSQNVQKRLREKGPHKRQVSLPAEPRNSQELTKRAKEMIRASQERMNELTTKSPDMSHEETTQEIRQLRRLMENEQNLKTRAESQLKKCQQSSQRHTEQLICELELLRAQSSSSNST